MNATDRHDIDGADVQSGALAQPAETAETTGTDAMDAMDKERLVLWMKTSYERFEAALADLDERQWLAVPREGDGWSARDVVAHLTSALEFLRAQVEAAAADHAPPVNMVNLSHAEIEAATVEAFDARRTHTPQQALGEFRMTYGRLRDAVEVTSWDDLSIVGRFKWLDGIPLWRLIARGTWEHFDRHLPAIERASTMRAD